MKRILLSLCLIIIFSTAAFAGPLSNFIFLGTDSEQYPIQDFQPVVAKQQEITAGRTTVDMSTWLHWEIYCSVESTYHTLTTATVTGVRKIIPATMWHGRGVYHGTVKSAAASAFTSFSTTGTCQLEGM